MSDLFSLFIAGQDRILEILNALPEAKREQLYRMLQASADRVFNASQREVPVDSGELKESGRVEPGIEGNRDVIEFSVVYGDGNGYGDKYGEEDGYSWFVELGTSNMIPQPYLGPAFEEESQNLVNRLGKLADSVSSDE